MWIIITRSQDECYGPYVNKRDATSIATQLFHAKRARKYYDVVKVNVAPIESLAK